MNCDICGRSGRGNTVPANQFSRAVRSGFNPFYNGCMPEPFASMGGPGFPERWALSAISGDTSLSDWFVCSSCMDKLRPFL